MSRVAARRGLPAGAASRAFPLAELAAAAARAAGDNTTVLVDLGAGCELRVSGVSGVSGAARGPAWWAARCALRPHAGALLERAPPPASGGSGASGADVWVAVRLTAPLAPHDDLLLWPHPALLAHDPLPSLTTEHLTGDGEYVCLLCGARYPQPGALQLHLVLRCGAADPAALWARLAAQHAPRRPAPALPAPRSPAPRPPALPDARGAALEALAAAWGRAAAGHLCLYCGKLYSRKYGLKIHIRTHTGYKPLRCRHCHRHFGDPSNLNKHVRLHDRHVTT